MPAERAEINEKYLKIASKSGEPVLPVVLVPDLQLPAGDLLLLLLRSSCSTLWLPQKENSEYVLSVPQ